MMAAHFMAHNFSPVVLLCLVICAMPLPVADCLARFFAPRALIGACMHCAMLSQSPCPTRPKASRHCADNSTNTFCHISVLCRYALRQAAFMRAFAQKHGSIATSSRHTNPMYSKVAMCISTIYTIRNALRMQSEFLKESMTSLFLPSKMRKARFKVYTKHAHFGGITALS